MKDKVKLIFFLCIIVSLIFGVSYGVVESKNSEIKHLELKDEFFKDYQGSFILYDDSSDSYYIYNEEQVNERLSPCSTFKIVNSLIGLETGVIKGKNYTYSWDGTNYPIDSWNRDHTLETAIANSVVWYYQRLAQDIGEERMQDYLNRIEYGNKDITGGIRIFWLGSSLKISGREQVELLKKLYHNDLPFGSENTSMVRDILILESNDKYVFSGKTGASNNKLGWFVGALQKGDNNYYFATNILAQKDATGYKAKEITIDILESLNLYN